MYSSVWIGISWLIGLVIVLPVSVRASDPIPLLNTTGLVGTADERR